MKFRVLKWHVRYITYLETRNLVMDPPMTKEQLGQFNGRSSNSRRGHFVPGRGSLRLLEGCVRVVYPVVEEGRARDEDFQLPSALIERINFDAQENVLTLGLGQS